MSRIHPLLMACTLALSPVSWSAGESTAKTLYAQRDAELPGVCVPPDALPSVHIVSHTLEGGATLHVLPCRATVADMIHVAILERGAVVRTLSFPDPGVSAGERWQDARLDRIGVTRELSSLQMLEDGSLVSSNRLPPGLGEGLIVQHYRLEDGSPVLTRFAIELQARDPITLWPLP